MSKLFRPAIVVLAAYYGCVVYTVANPKVSAAYREYYILKTSNLSIAQREKLRPLQIGKMYSHRDPALGFGGWSDPEERHRWSAATSARIIFRLDGAASKQAHGLVLHIAPLGTQRTVWRLNGTQIAQREIKEETELRLPLAGAILRQGENVLQIDLPDARRPGSDDPRTLALAFTSLTVE